MSIISHRVPPEDPSAPFCVSTNRYFKTQIEAEDFYESAKGWPSVSIDLWKRQYDEWVAVDWFGYPEE
ncbi:hypothetical protein [uncultured Sphingomonas sp.]|uniref:hypothetical protein n=1 Tax=uncultured Sphingomonas sp. TaxID=158754 RepID=UPI0035CA1CEB